MRYKGCRRHRRRAKAPGQPKNRSARVAKRGRRTNWDTIQTPRSRRPASSHRHAMTRLPHLPRRTERSADFAVWRSVDSSTTTRPAPRSRNSSNAFVSAAPPSWPTSTAEASNDAPSRSSGTARTSPPPLAATRTVPRSPRSPRNSDSIRQPPPTASAEQASRPDLDEDGVDRPTNTPERDSWGISREPTRPAGSSSRVSQIGTYVMVMRGARRQGMWLMPDVKEPVACGHLRVHLGSAVLRWRV